ncbi:hypothetical protein [Bartonella refiksaydamii]|uniref:hypothetical protein n=1 Tax=Bartonella refiksaydamii TaxID=2654951 RepID=UPI0012EC13D5|nr:hypothetical protein [Bartonella refiksaydamii]
MTNSLVALMALRFLTVTVTGTLFTMVALVFLYLLIKYARLYCKVKKQLKRVLKERDTVLEQISKKEKQNEAEFSV